MPYLNSPLLRSQIENDQELSQKQLESIMELLKAGITHEFVASGNVIDENVVDNLSNAWAGLIIASLDEVEQALKFAREDANVFEMFYSTLHHNFHMSDADEGDVLVYPVVSRNLDGFYFYFPSTPYPVKILEFTQSEEECNINAIIPNETFDVFASAPGEPKDFTSLCAWDKEFALRGLFGGDSEFTNAMFNLISSISPELLDLGVRS